MKTIYALSALLSVAACGSSAPAPVDNSTPKRARETIIVQKGESFSCTPTAVYDGDGPVWCAEGPKLRLAGIAAREMNGECRPGHPCPAATAEEARDALVNLLGGPKGKRSTGHILVSAPAMSCTSVGSAKGERTGAWCTMADGREINCAMVATGTALKWDRYWKNHGC